MMKPAEELSNTIQTAVQAFAQIHAEAWAAKPDAATWSKKEIIGHLIDSACTNMRRLVVSQYEQNQKIVYLQEQWVALQNYQQADHQELIDLWRLLNRQMVRVMNNIPESSLQHQCDTGKERVEYHTLDYIMTDYVAHLKHHLSQLIPAHKQVSGCVN
jgi:hypothetical protein